MPGSMNIALLGNCTTEYIGAAIKDECCKYGISACVYNAPYNQYILEILNQDSGFYISKPDLTIILLEGKLLFGEWYSFKNLQNESEKRSSMITTVFNSIASIIEKVHSCSDTKIIINNFKVPYYSPLGILDGKYQPGLKHMIVRLNLKLEEWASEKNYVYVFDYNGLCAQFGNRQVEDRKMFYAAKSTVSLPYTMVMAKEYMRYILPLRSVNRKCLVLDLDNTLWGGIAGEDGISGIKLDVSGTGKSFYDFQMEILNLYHRGIILAVNSKNNLEDALGIMENHPHMLLRKKFFAILKINWQDKAWNLREIAKELNIGIDSLVFFDDNPVEREYVKSVLPQVKVIEVPEDTSKYVEALLEIPEFEHLDITAEDMKRSELYEVNKRRIEAQQHFKNREIYLASLESKLIVEYANKFTIPRIAQLTQKTNQFNMTTKRYDSTAVENMAGSGKYLVLSCSASDRFGDNGIVGVCIAGIENTCANIDTFLLSCRVLGRNMEYAFLSAVAGILREKGVVLICSKFIKTEKNKTNENFYLQAGFSYDSAAGNETCFSFLTSCKLKDFKHVEVIINKPVQPGG